MRDLYALHAAGVRAPGGGTILLIGPSGSGKSTLAYGLVRQGWGYLSDDALLLRRQANGVDAVAFRKPFSVATSGAKHRVDVRAAYPNQHVEAARPDLLLFPRIVCAGQSEVRRLTPADALRRLLCQGGPELYDRSTMARQLAVMTSLLRQGPAYELRAARDLYERPHLLLEILARAHGTCNGTHRH
jgi:hypothetical protein